MPRFLTLTVALLALAPSVAAAETFYAAPNGAYFAACTSADPCDVATAIEKAKAGDGVELASGDYPVSEMQLTIGKAIIVRGPLNAARPRLISSGGTTVTMTAGTLRDVEIVQGGSGPVAALHAENARVERVIVRAGGEEGLGASLRGTTVIQSSVVLAPAAGSRAIEVVQSPGGVKLHHVTARGDETALWVDAPGGDAHAIVESSILRAANGSDVRLTGESGNPTASLRRSAYRPATVAGTVQDLGGNVAADPLLQTDQFHQAEGSPTIDKGATPADGPATDIDGGPRSQGAAPDIGADELPAPPPDEPDVPTPTPTPTPTPAPETVPPDPTLPGVISARFPSTPVAGRPTDLVIEARDPDSAILGVIVDLGPAGVVGLSACRTLKPSGPFVPGQTLKFTIPVVFPAPGLQPYTLEIRSGGCGGTQQVSRTEQSTQVQSGALVARAAQASRCAGAVAPRAGSEARVAAAVVCLMNRERAKRRLRPLTLNKKLVKSAAAHTADMLARGYYNHQRPGGPTLKARTRKAKYRGNSGENLGLASGVLARPAGMMKMWMKSPMHRANVLNRRFRAVGVVVQAKDPMKKMSGAAIYTVNFGTRRK